MRVCRMLFGSDNEANFQASLKFSWRAKDYKKVKYGLYIQIYRRIYTFFFYWTGFQIICFYLNGGWTYSLTSLICRNLLWLGNLSNDEGGDNRNSKKSNREEKSLRHVAMVAKLLDDNKSLLKKSIRTAVTWKRREEEPRCFFITGIYLPKI